MDWQARESPLWGDVSASMSGMRTLLLVAVLCLVSSSPAVGREPPHPNPTTFVEQVSTLYLSRVWLAGGKVVVAELVRLTPAQLRTCRNRTVDRCQLARFEWSHEVSRDAGRVQQRLRTVDFVANTGVRPRAYWNANGLQQQIVRRFTARRKHDLELRLGKTLKRLKLLARHPAQPAKYVPMTYQAADSVVSLPLGQYPFTATMLGALYVGSHSGRASFYIVDLRSKR